MRSEARSEATVQEYFVLTRSRCVAIAGVDGSKILNSSIRKVESLMSMGGLFGVRKRAVSDHRRNSNSGIPSR